MEFKNDDIAGDPTATKLDEELMEQFSDELEKSINQVCEKNDGKDPRVELLVSLLLFAAQVSYETGFERDELFVLLDDLYDDLYDEPRPEPIDPKFIN